MSGLMFIGASPSSAGGGIRTTTFAIVLIFLITFARGGKSIKIFKREIHNDDFINAVNVTLMAFFLIFVLVFVFSFINSIYLFFICFIMTYSYISICYYYTIT